MAKKNRVKVANASALVTLACVTALLVHTANLDTDAPISVETVRVSTGIFETVLNLSGTINYETQAACILPQAGRVSEVYCSRGDAVLKGELLFSFNVDSERALLEKAYGEHDYMQAAALERQIGLAAFRAPTDGVLTDIAAFEEGYLAAGSVGALVASNTHVVEISTVQADAARIKKGMAVRLFDGDTAIGIGRVVSMGPLMPNALVKIISDEKLSLPVGAQLRAQVLLFSKADVLLVPSSAVDDEGRIWRVYNGRIFPVEQSVLQLGQGNAWVREGLEGMEIVLKQSDAFKIGQRVKEVGK